MTNILQKTSPFYQMEIDILTSLKLNQSSVEYDVSTITNLKSLKKLKDLLIELRLAESNDYRRLGDLYKEVANMPTNSDYEIRLSRSLDIKSKECFLKSKKIIEGLLKYE